MFYVYIFQSYHLYDSLANPKHVFRHFTMSTWLTGSLLCSQSWAPVAIFNLYNEIMLIVIMIMNAIICIFLQVVFDLGLVILLGLSQN